MSINKPRVLKESPGLSDDMADRAIMPKHPKREASHAKSRPGTKGQKPDESGPETWPGGIDRFHENL